MDPTILAAAGPALGAVSASAVGVHPTSRWRKGEDQRTGWSASRRTTVEVLDLTVVGELIAQPTAAGATRVSGPFWAISPDTPAHALARTCAAQNARERAHAYADGLDLKVGRVVGVAEPGLRHGGEDHGFGDGVEAMSSSADADAPLDVTPAEQTVRAQVEVAFAFEP